MEKKLIAILRDILPENAQGVVQTLLDNGVNNIEISISNKEIGFETLKTVVNSFKGKLKIGVGTVTSIDEVIESINVGAEYIITPAYDQEIVNYCIQKNIEIIPGVFTPSDVMKAVKSEIKLLKLFPANAFPVNYVRALKGPFPDANFLAVGGVTIESAKSYLTNGFSGLAPGSDLVKRAATLKDLDGIAKKAKKYVEVCK